MVDSTLRSVLWQQAGAAIDALGNAIRLCPDDLWNDRARMPFWYTAYHTLFFLDIYTYGNEAGFTLQPPFTLDERELKQLPETPYTKDQLLEYLSAARERCRNAITSLTDERAAAVSTFEWLSMSYLELILYNMRHVQHHAAQLNL